MTEINTIIIDELNEQIIKYLTGVLYSFCFGIYKEEKQYPEAVMIIRFQTSEGKKDFEIRARLNKNDEGILERAQFIVINRNKQRQRQRQKQILNN